MRDFFLAAFPWVFFSVLIAVVCNNLSKRKKSLKIGEIQKDFKGANIANEIEDKEQNYMSYGISFGLLLGVAVGASFLNILGPLSITYCSLAGMLIGRFIKK